MKMKRDKVTLCPTNVQECINFIFMRSQAVMAHKASLKTFHTDPNEPVRKGSD